MAKWVQFVWRSGAAPDVEKEIAMAAFAAMAICTTLFEDFKATCFRF
jgi:hypothetical protein